VAGGGARVVRGPRACRVNCGHALPRTDFPANGSPGLAALVAPQSAKRPRQVQLLQRPSSCPGRELFIRCALEGIHSREAAESPGRP